MVTNEDFAKRFKQIRLEKGVTEKEMGQAIGHTEKYIKNIESGVTLPTIRHFFDICAYFGIYAYQFFDFNLKYPIHFNVFVSELEKLNYDEKDMILNVIKDMVRSNERRKLNN